jgi:hypothetical protein
MGGYVYKKHRKEYCENIDGRYGFVCTSTIVAPLWQLEVDHIDGNHKNNQIVNLQTLCSCCHRYKTMIFQENLKVERRKNYHEKIFENTFGKQNENPIQSRSAGTTASGTLCAFFAGHSVQAQADQPQEPLQAE